jgi:hypothetical protein
MTAAYADFLASKTQLRDMGGFEPTYLPDYLFPFQRALTEWAIRQGRAGLFADCGLGKSPMELVWAQNVHEHTGKPVLMVTPLAVGFQIKAEADKFGGIDAAVSRDGSVAAAITITNYERLEKFNPADYGGVVCDESSAIKAFDGVRRAIVTEFLRQMPYRLLGTATAAPNDYVELGTASEALGQLGHIDMLNRFFINAQRTSDTRAGGRFGAKNKEGWRFKGHGQDAFWRWVSSWARAIRKPSDFGFDDDGFTLPPLDQRITTVEARAPRPDTLFDVPASGLAEEREVLRRTITERCEHAAELLADADSAVAWCHLNDESKLLTTIIPGAVEVSGSDSTEAKEEKLRAFTTGQFRVLVIKPKIGAFGLNWQHCHRMTYFPSHSYEQMYQAIRRSWRFGQTHPVTVDMIITDGGAGILANLQRKAVQADAMFTALVGHMNTAVRIRPDTAFTTPMEMPPWLA